MQSSPSAGRYLVSIHLITRPHRPELARIVHWPCSGVSGQGWTIARSLRIGAVAVLRSVRRDRIISQPIPVPATPAAPAPGAAFPLSL